MKQISENICLVILQKLKARDISDFDVLLGGFPC